MKRKHVLFSFTIITTITLSLSITEYATANRSGAPGGNTGAPGDATCAKSNCHAGSAVTGVPGLITSDIPGSGYVPGETYTISATASKAGGTRFGFQVTAKDEAEALAGDFTAINANTLSIIGKYMTHTTAGTVGTDSKTWMMEWTAPSTATGDITFYGAFNLANNDNTKFGDEIVTSTLTVSIDPTASTSKVDSETISIYPSPFRDNVTFELPSGAADVQLYNASGILVASFRTDNGGAVKKDLSELETGIYFVRIKTDYRFYSQRIVKVL